MITPLLLNLAHHRFLEESTPCKFTSCDGLLVVGDVKEKLLLANPATKEFKELPQSPYVLDRHGLDFTFGIGYDSLTDDYKVVTNSVYIDLTNVEEEDIMLVDVYSVKYDTWKRVNSSSYTFAATAAAGVYVHGHIHWIFLRTSDYSSVIVAFDLKEEKFHPVPLPSSVDCMDYPFLGHLVILEGCLCMVHTSSDCSIDLYMMTEYNVEESWTKFISFAVHEDLQVRPLCSLSKEQMVLLMDEQTNDERLAMYNVKEGTFKDIVVQGIPQLFYIKMTFVESLLSPHFVYRNAAVDED